MQQQQPPPQQSNIMLTSLDKIPLKTSNINNTDDMSDDPIVKDVVQMEIPYLKDEVTAIMHYLHDNKDKIKKK